MLLHLLRSTLAWPPVDIVQQPDSCWLLCDLPGLDHHRIKLELIDRAKDRYLVISGENDQVKQQQQVVRLRRERPTPGPFRRVFVLPDDVNLDAITATIDKGVLKVVLPRSSQLQRPRNLQSKWCPNFEAGA